MSTPPPPPPPTYTIRPHTPHDTPSILSSHRTQFLDEYGWNEHYMDVVAGIIQDFTAHHNPELDRFWVASHTTTNTFLGCVMLIQSPTAKTPGEKKAIARLRILFVSPSARGMGLGKALVRTTLSFARSAGYERVQLTTTTWLGPANRVYEKEGFREVSGEENEMFGPRLRHVVLEVDLREGKGEVGEKVVPVMVKEREGSLVVNEEAGSVHVSTFMEDI